MDAQTKVSRAITKLMIQYPFYGSLALSSNAVSDDSIPTMCTDGRSIKWNPKFVDSLTALGTIFVMAHEVMHIAFKHPLRIGDRDPKRWNIACDFMINYELVKQGIGEMPEDGLYDERWANMSAEQIYAELPENTDEIHRGKPNWQMGDIAEPKDEKGKKLQPTEIKQIEADINQKTIMAAEAAKAVGRLPTKIQQLVNIMRRADVDLDTVMSRFIGGDTPNDYSFSKIRRRPYAVYDMVLPSIVNVSVGHTVVAIDSSASVSDKELQYFLGLLNQLVDDKQPESVTIITWDTKVQTVTKYGKGENISDVALSGRGGTAIRPVFKHVDIEDIECDQMIVLSDLQIFDYPETAPRYPVLWVSSWLEAAKAPWGETTYMNAA
tara:strand:+ start:389 stop:1528 length:1140 start_codon:yes stop_codon:yes gene_type:complete